jgi:hypothetical protein
MAQADRVHSTPPLNTSKTKAKNEAIAMRDALPFFRKGRGKVEMSWWDVKPSGDYAADLQTGEEYARAFLPMLSFNAGASDLGAIVSDIRHRAAVHLPGLRSKRR